MSDTFSNVYEDAARAASYAALEFPGTYYLAYRDLPEIIKRHLSPTPNPSLISADRNKGGESSSPSELPSPGSPELTSIPFGAEPDLSLKGRAGYCAVDFGCGAGRSTRFLKKLGFEAVGVDISEQMIALARQIDPQGDYRVCGESGPTELPEGAFDLVQSVFTFDNVPMAAKATLFGSLRRLLKPTGKIVSLVSTPDIYTHDWASFRTTHFESNFKAKSGDTVYTVMLDVEDQRPVSDVLCLHEDYECFYREAGLQIEATYRPLGRADEPIAWVNETRVAPWIIYVLAPLPA